MPERDLFAPTLRDANAIWKIFRNRVVKRNLTPRYHLRQQERGEDLGDRSDFENGIAIECAVIPAVRFAVRHDPLRIRIKGRRNNANTLPGRIDAFAQGRENVVSRERLATCGLDE
jgi:hypothetical protein